MPKKKATKKVAVKKANKMGRPKIEINWDEFDKLCSMQATLVEIANWFGCSEDTIERRVVETYGVTFAEHYKNKSSKGKISLRRKQFEVALTGNTTMLIWLGKQHLDQKDKTENVNDNTHKGDMNVNVARVDLEERIAQVKGEAEE